MEMVFEILGQNRGGVGQHEAQTGPILGPTAFLPVPILSFAFLVRAE